MSRVYPIFLVVEGKPALVVGGGKVALRKARGLAQAGARVVVVAPRVETDLLSIEGVTAEVGAYSEELMRRTPPWVLVFAATDQPGVNEAVMVDARRAGILCCRCDGEEAGDFVGGATMQHGAVTISVSTQGASPVLARRIRNAASEVDPLLFQWAELLARVRGQVLERVGDAAVRRALLLRMAGEEVEACLRQEGEKAAELLVLGWLDACAGAAATGGGKN